MEKKRFILICLVTGAMLITRTAVKACTSINLNGKPVPGKPRPQGDENDGTLMRQALETCATLKDFELLLDSIKGRGPIPSNSNFAVMDAQGGVAYYETGNNGYTKFDVIDILYQTFATDKTGHVFLFYVGTASVHVVFAQGIENLLHGYMSGV